MHTDDLLALLNSKDPEVRRRLRELIALAKTPPVVVPPPEIVSANATAPADTEIRQTCQQLRELGYSPSVAQLVKFFTGSRGVVDSRLRGLPGFKRYRNCLTRKELTRHLTAFAGRAPEILLETVPRGKATVAAPWREIDFFATDTFNKLDDAKATELLGAVTALGLRKATDRLPGYMAKARTHLPRAFEPWTDDERALLIETMCYTNDVEQIASIFGRSASAVRDEGKKLIWKSMHKNRAA